LMCPTGVVWRVEWMGGHCVVRMKGHPKGVPRRPVVHSIGRLDGYGLVIERANESAGLRNQSVE